MSERLHCKNLVWDKIVFSVSLCNVIAAVLNLCDWCLKMASFEPCIYICLLMVSITVLINNISLSPSLSLSKNV